MNQRGFSLIELLCALVIGLMLISLVVQTFVEYKISNKLGIAFSEIQENIRFSSNILRSSIRLAGYVGCARLSHNLPVIDCGVLKRNIMTAKNSLIIYSGNNSNWFPSLPRKLRKKVKSNTDAIEVRFMRPVSSSIVSLTKNIKNKFIVGLIPKFKKKQDLIISNCHHVVQANIKSIYRSKAKGIQTISATEPIRQYLSAGDEVGSLVRNVFFIGLTARKNKIGKSVYSLYWINESGKKSELISNVIDMKISGLINNLKIPSNQVQYLEKANMVKISLLFVSGENVFQTPKSYEFNGKKYLPDDNRLYKSVSMIISLRERL